MKTHFLLATQALEFQRSLKDVAKHCDCVCLLRKTSFADIQERLSQSPMIDFVFLDSALLGSDALRDIHHLRQTSPLTILIVLIHKHQEKTWGFLHDAGVHLLLPITISPADIKTSIQQFNIVDACNPRAQAQLISI